MSDAPLAKPIEASQATIADDMPCVICGYNLRGLTAAGRCPECGSPVARSIHGDLLRYADGDWLAKLLLGIRLMLWSILTGLVLGIFAIIARALASPMVFAAGLTIIMAGLDVAAAILITVQEPRITLSEKTVTWRKAVRTCAGAAFFGQILQQLGTASGDFRWLVIVGTALGLANVVAYFGKLIYLRQFALRIPDPRLARSTKIVMWGLGIVMASGLVIGLVAVILVRPTLAAAPSGVTTAPAGRGVATATRFSGRSFGATGTASVAAMGALGCFAGLGSLVFGIWYLVLLFGYRNAFRDALAQARQYAPAAT